MRRVIVHTQFRLLKVGKPRVRSVPRERLEVGIVGYSRCTAKSQAFAEDLARFVLALRAAPTEGRVFTGPWRGGLLTSQDEAVADGLERNRGMIDVDALARLWAELRTTPRTEPDVWAHRDLMPGNLLVADGRLAGVIDVGTLTVADPAIDLQAAWNLLDMRARSTFRAALGSDDDEWRRGIGVGLRPGRQLPLVLRRDQPGHVPHRPPHVDRAPHCRVATNTNSLPGRSGAARTSSMLNPANDSSSSPRSRNRSVESDVSTAPSDPKT